MSSGSAGGGLPAGDLSQFVGHLGEPTKSRHPVNEAMIAHWCDAMGDTNPCYTDEARAAASIHRGIVAPPAMLDVWDRPGLAFARNSASPRVGVLNALFEAGFDSIVAVNTELSFERYLRPGEWISGTEVLEDVSSEKRTSRGPGHFVTTRHRFVSACVDRAGDAAGGDGQLPDGEHVGDLMFRMLVFRPEVADARYSSGDAGRGDPSAGDPGAGDPSSDPSLRPPPAVNQDNAFFWEGTKKHELRVQQCQACGALLAPPGPRCPKCGSFDMGWIVASGRGSLYSFAVPEYPKVAGFSYPLCVGLVELAEGTRLVSNIVGLTPEQLEIGMPLELGWLETGGFPLPQFRAPTPQPRLDTVRAADLRPGQTLPPCSIPITTTLVVAGAIATRDYTAVHHDRDVAEREGSKDVFLNINTSVGLIERVVTDWLGPEAVFRSIKVRLGAPGYPGDLLTFIGEIAGSDASTGAVTLTLKASDSFGDHATATVEVALSPGETKGHAGS